MIASIIWTVVSIVIASIIAAIVIVVFLSRVILIISVHLNSIIENRGRRYTSVISSRSECSAPRLSSLLSVLLSPPSPASLSLTTSLISCHWIHIEELIHSTAVSSQTIEGERCSGSGHPKSHRSQQGVASLAELLDGEVDQSLEDPLAPGKRLDGTCRGFLLVLTRRRLNREHNKESSNGADKTTDCCFGLGILHWVVGCGLQLPYQGGQQSVQHLR